MSYCEYRIRIVPDDKAQNSIDLSRAGRTARQAARAALRSADVTGSGRITTDGGGVWRSFRWTADKRVNEQAYYSVR